ncbi:di-trans,poly-cis-decaprenylcistransferase [bacterium]|nr:di-trans,poly-cis-decaprenylcistransferase [bacterium]|tara:strand:- start:734 stop:1462 length:729 start_codon:yes stop_codon:yes gene_type:complete
MTESKHKNPILDIEKLPKHIAIIMDGNGRWAKSKHKNRLEGHKKGVKALKDIIKTCIDINIKCLSAYTFSTENWKRPKSEVSFLMNLLEIMIKKEVKNLKENNVKVNIIGNKQKLSKKLIEKIELIESKTNNCTGMILNLMINYGSRDEIINAVNQIKNNKTLSNKTITQDIFQNYLYTQALPDPEILIRTSGEKRISNFMLWQISYSELYFTDTLWPDFTQNELLDILIDYQDRNRRFGGL